MTHSIPKARDGSLHQHTEEGSSLDPIAIGTAAWFSWLEQHRAFCFETRRLTFTARKEQRPGGWYWYAYRRSQGKLHSAYLGKSEELTLQRLSTAAETLERAGEALAGGTHRPLRVFGDKALQVRQASIIPLPTTHTVAEQLREPEPVPKHHLPVPLTPLIGREQETANAAVLLRRPEIRLLTMIGTAGIGKTRLALQVAADLLDDFADGVSFVSLAPIRDPDLVLATIVQTLGLKVPGNEPVAECLSAFLQNKHLLLVLDNFEQVLAAASPLVELLTASPQLKLLVTSREVLHLHMEQQFSVPPLALPDLTHLPDSETLAQYPAVKLFIQRAQAVKHDFQVAPANAAIIAEVCTRLDGLPLALELAAARIKLLSPPALLARLDRRLQVLTGGARDLPERQRTLRATIEWSYNLLNAQEQRLFRWLSIFVGGCTLAAAEALCQADQEDGEQASSVFEGVASLLDKSLVQQTEREGEEPRLVMLETLREFGLACLQGSGELEAARRAHARYYLELAEQAEPELRGPNQATWLHRLEQEHDNLRAALEWALEEVAEEQARERREMALRLSTALKYFWLMHGHYREAYTFLERALARSEGASASLRAKVLRVITSFVSTQGDHGRAELLAQQSLALYRELGDIRGIAKSLASLAVVAWKRGKLTEALSLDEEIVRLIRQVGEPREVAEALCALASQVSALGEYAKGQALFEEALLLFRQAGNELWVGITLVQSAFWLWLTLGDLTTMRQRLQQGQALITKVGHRHWSAHSSWVAALIALSEQETARADDLAQESLAVFREIGDRWWLAWTLHVLGRVERQRGDLQAARSRYRESLALTQQLGEKWITPFPLEGLAGVVATQGDLRWAAQLWGAAEALREAMAFPLLPADRAGYEQAVQSARAQLGASAFAAAWAEGRAMTPGQALAAQEPAVPRSAPTVKTSPTYPAGLTAREVEILRLVAQGLTDGQVAETLVISPRTVNWHLTAIYSKLQVSSRNAATRYAIEHHLI